MDLSTIFPKADERTDMIPPIAPVAPPAPAPEQQADPAQSNYMGSNVSVYNNPYWSLPDNENEPTQPITSQPILNDPVPNTPVQNEPGPSEPIFTWPPAVQIQQQMQQLQQVQHQLQQLQQLQQQWCNCQHWYQHR